VPLPEQALDWKFEGVVFRVKNDGVNKYAYSMLSILIFSGGPHPRNYILFVLILISLEALYYMSNGQRGIFF